MTTWPAMAAILESPDADFQIQDVEVGPLQAGEALVQVLASGICRTDTEARELTPTPSVLGHEGVGVVEAVSPGTGSPAVGDLVVMSYPSCGECDMCAAGRRWLCIHNWSLSFDGQRLDGSCPVSREGVRLASAFFQQSSFATRAVVPSRSLVLAPRDVPIEVLAAMPCGVMTGAGAVLNVLNVRAGDSVAVIGVGAVGLAAVMAAKVMGAETIIAIDVHSGRLALSRRLGATHTIRATRQSVPAVILRLFPGGVRAVLDTTGRASSWIDAVAYLERGGDIAFVTTPEPVETYAFPPFPLFLKCGNLRSVLLGCADSHELLPTLFDWYRQGIFPVDELVRTYPLRDIGQALDDAARGDTIKPVLLM